MSALANPSIEIEIKLRAPDAASAWRLVEALGFVESSPRVLERNRLFDTADGSLRSQGLLIRIREHRGRTILTYKGKAETGVHKSREEIEVGVDNAEALEAILRRLGYTAGFRYEKYRTEFMETGETGIVMLDETPIGAFLEIEGDPRWIDRTAARLGYSEPDYIVSSYYELYREYCEQQSIEPGDLVF